MTEREAKAFLNNLKVCIEEHPIVADWLVEIADRKTENSSEKPNNCEHITEDGVTCAKYPACDDCLDNPLNKLKGSERLVKGSEQTEPTISKMEQVEPQTDCGDFADRLAYERGVKHAWEVAQKVFNSTVTFYEAEDVAKQIDKDINVRSKDEPQICDTCRYYNSNIPCGSTPSACKEADKFAEEFVEGLKKLKPTISKMEQVDKTQTCSFSDCDNFKNPDYARCIECKLKQIKAKDEPQTYITEDRDTQILDAWQVHHRNTTSVKDEPQAERSE